MSNPSLQALVHTLRYEAQGIISVELRPAAAGVVFPGFEPGSHIDLHLPNGLVRSYSLVNPAGADRQRYVVGVLNDRNSRGGSRYVHEQLRVGMTLPISAPRNNFRLHESAPRSVLVAGGIGVTPICCMLQRLMALGQSADVIYCARTRSEAAFVADIAGLASERVRLTWHFDDEQGGSPNLQQLLTGYPLDTHFYGCGPAPMLNAFEKACEVLGYENAHVERFAATRAETPAASGSYVVELQRSGRSLRVEAGRSILDTLLDAGLTPDFNCREGVCGACETKVICGEVAHRDSILTKQEQAANKSMMICVSHGKGAALVLDL